MVGSADADLFFRNCAYSGNVSAGQNAGGLVGDSVGEFTAFIKCHSSGSVYSESGLVGGLAGFVLVSDVENSSAAGTAVSEEKGAGGLIGEGYIVQLMNSYFEGDVEGYQNVGGLVGSDDSDESLIHESYFTGNVTANDDYSNAGGLAGLFTGTIHDSYSEADIKNYGTDGIAAGLVAGGLSGELESSYFNGTVDGDVIYGIGDTSGLLSPPDAIPMFNKEKAQGCIDETEYGFTLNEMISPETYEDNYWAIPTDTELCPMYKWYMLNGDLPKQLCFYDAGGPIYVTGDNFVYIASYKKITDGVGSDVFWTPNSDYILTEDVFIESDGTAGGGCGSPSGTLPLGDDCNPFTGSLTAYDGVTVTIEWEFDSGDPEKDIPYPGVFRTVEDAVFDNIHLVLNVVGDDGNDGGMIGWSRGVEIYNSSVTGTQMSAGIHSAGGFIGTAEGRTVMDNCSVELPVFGSEYVGGLIGNVECNDQTLLLMNDCRYNFTGASGSVVGDPDGTGGVGGLVGHPANSIIENSSVNGSFSGNETGGLVGVICSSTRYSLINNCSAQGSVNGINASGGLAGSTDADISRIMNSYSTADIAGETAVGGLVGAAYYYPLMIESSYSTGHVTSSNVNGDDQKAGGLVGYFGGDSSSFFRGLLIVSSFTAGHVEIVNTDENAYAYVAAGGLVGHVAHLGRIIDSYATGSVRSQYTSNDVTAYAGGLVGHIESGLLMNSMALNEFINCSAPLTAEGKTPVNRLFGLAVNDAGDMYFVCDPDTCTGGCCTDIYDCDCDGSCCEGEWVPVHDTNALIILNCYGWDLMQNSAALFEQDDYYNGQNITRKQVWNNYPNDPAPWTMWSHPTAKINTLSLLRTLAGPENWEQASLRLNDYKWFKLPVPEFGQGAVEADARHLIPKEGGNNGGTGTGNATVGTGGSKVINPETPGGYEEEEEPPIIFVSVILLFMLAVAAFCFVRGSDEADAGDEK